jgi:hypothetical protein
MVGDEHPAITERSARRSLERSKLRIKRVRQAEVIVVEKRNELRTTGENPGVASARQANIAPQSDVANSRKVLTDLGRLVG